MIQISIRPPGMTYPVHIGAGIFDDLAEALGAHCPATSYTLITDSNVATHYGGRVRNMVSQVAPCRMLEFPAGETSKNRATWAHLTDQMLEAGAGRDSAVIALGGGVAGDLAGFVAATYHRGIDLVHLPTSLLAMVDSSIGGKTGVDTASGKNLVGAFHQPRLVMADVSTVDTLPEREFTSGLAETLKHGAIADREYFDWIASGRTAIQARGQGELSDLVRRSVEIKASVVAEDELEIGRRATLNFGHTIGHAIEASTSYGLLHGEAIAIGMVAEAAAGERLGITDGGSGAALREVFGAFGLPVTLPDGLEPEAVIKLASGDKKNRRGRIRFSPIACIGRSARTKTGTWTFEIEAGTIADCLQELMS